MPKKGSMLSQAARDNIKVALLVKRLQAQALDDDVAEVSPIRLRAIEILLKKSLPDLAAIEITGNENKPLHIITRAI